jgi:endonuclease III
MTIKERYEKAMDWFETAYPEAKTELEYTDPFELIVAVILSAQCTDKRVNIITPPLMEKFPDAESMAKAEPAEIFEYIKSCSYPNNKAKHLSGMSRMLVAEFGGKIPSDPDELMKLPGVGRKTANVVASVIYRAPVMAVDTHVFRVANRIGLTRNAKNPRDAELQLTHHIPVSKVHEAHHWLILHGRYTCKARMPLCSTCGLTEICKYYLQNRNKMSKMLK